MLVGVYQLQMGGGNNLYKYNLSRLNSNSLMLSISDLNHIIKYYATRIQQRIEELQHLPAFLPDSPDQQDYDFISLIAKYAHYATTDEREIKLAKKLVGRVVQIFQFFRGRSSSQNLLAVIQIRIERELQTLVTPVPLKLGELFSYVHLLTRRGCVVRPPAQKKPVISRPIIIKEAKNEERAPTFSFFNLQKRVTSAVASNKQLRTNVNPPPTVPPEKWRVEDVLALWSGMDLDRGHIGRMKDSNEQLLLRDALRRNERLMVMVRKQDKRKNRRAVTEVSDECGILMEVKTNSLKPGWSKKRRLGLASRKKHNSIKENVSILV